MEQTGTKKPRLASLLGGLVVLAAVAVGGYFWWTESPPTKYTRPVEEVTIAEGQQPIAGPVYVGLEKGYFSDQGLDVILQPHRSGKSALNSVLEGNADFATVAETPLMHAGIREDKIYIIATIHNSVENTVVLARKDS